MNTEPVSRNGTDGRVYGGDPVLCHIPDGQRTDVGKSIAAFTETLIRGFNAGKEQLALCPGCYMVAIYNAAVALAQRNGQPLAELGRSMEKAFARLGEYETGGLMFIEEVEVLVPFMDHEG